MSDLIKDSIEQAQNIAFAGMKGGYEIAKRESAAKLAEKDAAIAELCEALQECIEYVPERSRPVLLRIARSALSKHTPILPNLHSHHDRAELLRDEYPDKYAGLKADAIRENGDTK